MPIMTRTSKKMRNIARKIINTSDTTVTKKYEPKRDKQSQDMESSFRESLKRKS